MPTYIIFRQEYSEKAGRLHGNPYVWVPVAKSRLKPPQDEEGFRSWLWQLVGRKYGEGYYRVVRTADFDERAGFHGVWMGALTFDSVTVDRSYQQYKSHPHLPESRQLWFKHVKERKKFYKRRRRR